MCTLISYAKLTTTRLAQGLLLAGLSAMTATSAQPTTGAAGIYTCTDASGRRITSDRLIPECTDREQKVLNPSGTVKAKVGPNLTARERAALEVKEKAEQEDRARQIEEKRRDRALLNRYPSPAVHDKERASAIAQIGVVRNAAAHRVEELMRQRTAVSAEMEFYKKDPSKAPPSLRQQAAEVIQSLAIQNRFIADQDGEIKRVNARFDDELARLKPLWAAQAAPLPPASSKGNSQHPGIG